MKTLSFPRPRPAAAPRHRWTQAFTLPEMMVAVLIFVFMVLGIIYAMLFGMRYDQLVCSKLGASDKSRMSFDLLTGEIRSAKSWSIGNISGNNKDSFTPCGNATTQLGNAVTLTNSITLIQYGTYSNYMVKVSVIWPFRWKNQNVYFTNTIANYYAPD